MKKILFCSLLSLALYCLSGCDSANAPYVDLNTGKPLTLVKDEKTGLMVNQETGKPVDLYVDTKNNDTINGRTGQVINGKVRKGADGTYVYTELLERSKQEGATVSAGEEDYKVKRTEDEYKIKKGDYKKEVEKDGDITIKDGNKKIKIDGETGERKVKYDD